MIRNMKSLYAVAIVAMICTFGFYVLIKNESQKYTEQQLGKIVVKNMEQFAKDVVKQAAVIKQNTLKKKPKIHLMVRMVLNKEQLSRIFCHMLRSTVLFWNKKYGPVLFILDNEDEKQDFAKTLNEMNLPLEFRVVYEKDFIRRSYIEQIGRQKGRPYGYLRMYYSSFIMDWYVGDDDIIAWLDSDVIFTMPVTEESLFRDGKIIAKGINQLHYSHIQRWAQITKNTIGVPQISDFMSYFPTPVYARTLRNLREYIMHRFNSTTFEEAYIKMLEYNPFISAVNVVFSYAWHFEHDLYDWHIDIGGETLESYNKKHCLPDRPLPESDTTPDLHITVHYRHYNRKHEALETSICYSQIALGQTNMPHCDRFRNKFNSMLFEFQSVEDHLKSWCKEGPKRDYCQKIVDERYKIWVDQYRKNGWKYNTDYLQQIQDFGEKKYGFKCPPTKYVNYQ